MNTSCVYIKTSAILHLKDVDFSWVLGSGSNLDKGGFRPTRVKYLLHQPAKRKSEGNMGSVPIFLKGPYFPNDFLSRAGHE